MKKLISIFLSIALLCTMAFPAFAVEVGTAAVDTVTGVHGETVILTLKLSDFDEADSILVTFEVPEALELILEQSQWLPDACVLTDISDGIAVCATATPEELHGDILALAFRLPAEGTLEPTYEVSYQVTLKKYGVTVAEAEVKGTVATDTSATKVTLSQNTLTLDLNGTTQTTLSAAVEPAFTTDTVSWISSDTTVATVDENGVVTAVKKGSTTITATAGQQSDTCAVTVTCSHQEVIDEKADATCTETGLTEGKHCGICGEVLVAQQTVPATGHTEVIDEAVAPSCTATGLTEGKHCDVCGHVIKAQEIVAANGHTEVIDKAVAATCTATGKTEGKHCSTCSAVLVAQQTVPAKGHTDANGDYTCDVCNEDLCTDHQEAVIAGKAPTCTETGLTEGKKCGRCGDILKAQDVIPAKGHTEVTDKAVAATCTATGLTEGKHCSVCNAVLVAQQPIPAKGHTEVVDKAVTATCTAAGKTEGKHCSVCNAVLVAQQPISAKGHTVVVDKAVAATCTAAGKTEGKHCSVCNTVLVAQQTVPAKAHTVVNDPKVDPTCTTNGKTAGSHCSVCNTVIKAQTVIPAAHTYSHMYDYKCDICGKERIVDMTRPMVDMFRMYDPNSGEHFYTGSIEERENLITAGWNYEGVGFTFPLTTGDPVHRLYDPVTGEHLYTMNVEEMNALLDAGWNYEGIAFNSGFENEVPQYRLHNPNETRGAYHFTASQEEKDNLIAAGWEYQGIGWYSLGA